MRGNDTIFSLLQILIPWKRVHRRSLYFCSVLSIHSYPEETRTALYCSNIFKQHLHTKHGLLYFDDNLIIVASNKINFRSFLNGI